MFNKMNTEEKTDYFKKVYKAASTNDAHELDGLLKEATENDDFENSLAGVCMELQVNRVLLLDETKLILYRKLLNLRFFHKYIIDRSSKNICDRIEFTKQLIQHLNESEKNDELFVLNLTFIAKQIFTFKRLLKSTYDTVPWEELEFCVLSFIKSFQDQNKFIIFTRAILNKTKIVKYLQTLQIQLDELRKESVTKLTKLPNLCRDDIIKKIVEKFPIYERLYTDHERLRDIYSLNFMLKYVKLIETIDLDKKHDKLILIRAYQVIGEHLKNTLESPKLSENTLTFLYLSLSKNSRKILIDLRDTLFHNSSCSTKNTFFGSLESDIFTGIKQDVEKVGEKINFILLKSEIAITKELAYKFVDAKDIENMKEIASVIDNVQFDSLLMESTSDIQNVDIRRLRDLVSRLKHHITPKHSSILEICEEMEKFLEKNASTQHKTFLKVLRCIYEAFENVYSYMLTPHGNMIHIESIKYDIERILRNLPSVKTDDMKSIAAKIFFELRSTSLNDECKNILYEIGYLLTFQLNDVSWAEKFKRKLKKLDHKDEIKSHDEKKTISKSELLTELKMIWSGISYCEFKSDEKIQAITEAILLDLIPMIRKSNSFIYFFDYNCPSLMWVDLRNHLAHNNVIMEVLEDFVMSTFLFVEKLLKVEEINMEDISSQSVTKVMQNYEACVQSLNKKELMFKALKKNNFDLFLERIHEGADYRSRDINMSTCLHLALTTPDNLGLIEFLWKKGLSSRQKNIRGHSALHIAALTGDAKNINFLLKKFIPEINAVDSIKRTASHYASLNGHVSVMEILHKHGADMTKIDSFGHSTLYYAIFSGIIEIVDFFFRKKLFHKLDGCSRGLTGLHIAARIGSLQMLKFLLDKGVNVNARNESGGTPLLEAIEFADIELVQILIDYGANVQFSDFKGFGSLHYVCEVNKVNILKLLIDNGADVNQKDTQYGFAPIHIAKNGHVKMVNILLENNAYINVSTKEGATPLHYAVENQHSEVVNVLISHKEIEVNCTDRYGMTPLLRAASNGDTKTIAILIEAGAEVHCRNNEDCNSLHLASQNGHEAAVNLLIANKISLKQKTREEGFVPLHSSVFSGNENIIKRLIEAGSDINATTINGQNCLHIAALEEKDIIDFLCREGVEVNAKTRNGHTPLHLAVINDNLHIVKQLVKAGCNVNAQDFLGNTPIHLAAESTTAEFLMDIGADLTIYNTKNQTAFEEMVKHDWIELIKKSLSSGRIKKKIILRSLVIPIIHSNMKMVKVLLKQNINLDLSTPADENGNTSLHLAASLGKVEIVELLLRYDVTVNLKNDFGASPLYLAASKGHDDIVEMLLERGADINAQACDGQTALHVASAHDHIKIVEILLNKGADVGKLNENQFSAVEIAVIRGSIKSIALFLSTNRTILKNKSIHKGFTLLHFASKSGRKEVVEFLLQEGANENAIDEDGNLPIHLAVLNGFPEIVDIFIEQGVSVDFIDKEKQSLLHFATRSGKLELVKHLVERGCNVNSINVNKETPIIAALKSGQREIAVFLLRNGAIINFTQDLKGISTNEDIRGLFSLIRNFFLFIETDLTGELEKLIKKDVPLNCVDSTKGSLLHFAARRGNVEAVKILLQNNATVDITDTKGWTPLHYAVKYSHVEIVFLLLSHGAKFDVETNNGKKPISFATNRKIRNLLRNIDECFEKINRKDISLVDILKKNIESENTMKPIVRAKNHHGITVVASAMKNKFLGIDQLEEIWLGNSLSKLNQGKSSFKEAKYQEAQQLFENIYAEMTELLGEDNPITLNIQSHIVKVLNNQDLYDEALLTQEEIYEKLVNQLGFDHEHTLRERVMIATLKGNLAKYEESLQIYQDVEKIQKQIFPSYHKDLLSTRKQMAVILMGKGKLELALKTLESVAQNEKMNVHISHLETLETEEYIAVVLSKQGKFNEAIQLFQKLLEEKKNLFGPYHPQIFATSISIIGIYVKRCEYYQASQEIEKLLNDQKKYLGTLHYDTLRTQVRKAHLLYKQHKNISAYKLYKETRQGLVDIRGSQCKEILHIDNMMKKIEHHFEFYYDQSNLNSFIEELVFSLNDSAKRGDIDTIKKLTNSGMSVTEKDEKGFNSLHHAVNGNNIDTLKYLLEHGGDITETTGKNNTLLHLACNKCYKEIAQFILNFVHEQELSKLINIATKTEKKTALHIAAERGSYEIVCLLLRKGAIFESLDKDSKRPIDLAQEERTKKILSLIEDIFEAVDRKDFSIIQNLNTLDNDEFMCVTNARNSRNLTILTLSINFGEREIADRILEMIKNKNAI